MMGDHSSIDMPRSEEGVQTEKTPLLHKGSDPVRKLSTKKKNHADGSKSFLGTEDVEKFDAVGRALVAEFLGTMLLVVVGCGACVGSDVAQPTTLSIALAFGFIIASVVQMIGHISGAHINPAVTIGLLACGRIGLIMSILYIPFQLAGAVAGAALLQYLVPELKKDAIGVVSVGAGLTEGQAFAVEAVITAVLLLVVCAVTDPNRSDLANSAPVAIGLAIACSHIFAVPLTGSGMNPARSFGPAAMVGQWDNQWIYWVAPLVGAACAGAVYRIIFRAPKDDDSSYDL
uniref:Aquaporin AQPcic n=1 Tax=Lygus hesperus TaxID=30085 RepID=A0A0A9VSJ4_LYGHE